MTITKRSLFKMAGAASLSSLASSAGASAQALPNLAAEAKPIGADERRARIARAQTLMGDAGVDALLLEAGSAMVYFTGINWWRSERFTGVVIPRDGEVAVVTPYFEEPSVRESMAVDGEVRTWKESENPFALAAGVLKDRGVKSGKIGVEETVRYFIVDGLAAAMPSAEIVSGADVTRGVRMIKSPAEIALMQTASDITMAAYRHVYPQVETGMSSADIAALMSQTTAALGGAVQFSLVLLNEASAYPHGSSAAEVVEEGGIILMDCGCAVHGYESDISRTWVHGAPTKKQCDVWSTVKRGQEIALETAQVGVAAGAVDDAVRTFYESKGYGPGYKTPGLSHRTGHGIGLDGHEPVNFVHGEKTRLAPGMCFSNEPGIYELGAFGVRLEDCLHMTENGPVLFSALSPSLDKPFG